MDVKSAFLNDVI
jgi:isopentenyldiphosphate isomerase